MVKTKPPRYPEENESKNSTYRQKGQAPKIKRYQGKNTQTKIKGPELKAETNFKGWCINLEGYIFDLGPRASDKFDKTVKDL